MIKVKTFTQTLEIFKTHKELEALDSMVNEFIEKKGVEKVISVSDATTTDNSGATIGIIRVLTYEE
ncbi:MAG: hypothetical protein ACE5HH_01325 [Candidatus Hydrothermarchaeales archaeon]